MSNGTGDEKLYWSALATMEFEKAKYHVVFKENGYTWKGETPLGTLRVPSHKESTLKRKFLLPRSKPIPCWTEHIYWNGRQINFDKFAAHASVPIPLKDECHVFVGSH